MIYKRFDVGRELIRQINRAHSTRQDNIGHESTDHNPVAAGINDRIVAAVNQTGELRGHQFKFVIEYAD
jgi:hypothetical protein